MSDKRKPGLLQNLTGREQRQTIANSPASVAEAVEQAYEAADRALRLADQTAPGVVTDLRDARQALDQARSTLRGL